MATYSYKPSDYKELRIASRDSGGVELVILVDHAVGLGVETIGIPAEDIPAIIDAMQARAGEHAESSS